MATTPAKKFTASSTFGTGDGEFTADDFAKFQPADLALMAVVLCLSITGLLLVLALVLSEGQPIQLKFPSADWLYM